MNNTGTDINSFEEPYNIGAIIVIVIFSLFAIIVCLNLLFNKHPNVC